VVSGRVLRLCAHNAGTAYKGAGPTTQDDWSQSTMPGRHQVAAPFSRVVAYLLRAGGREVC
jgi:hypothetical protein